MPDTCQRDGPPSPRGDGHEANVNQRRPTGVQGMKPDTATRRVKDGMSEKMVRINDHGGQHHESGRLPVVFPEQFRKGEWHQQMAGVMNEKWYHLYGVIPEKSRHQKPYK